MEGLGESGGQRMIIAMHERSEAFLRRENNKRNHLPFENKFKISENVELVVNCPSGPSSV
jgi:hypothetical protein